jgi:hypothetical protein
VHLGGFFQSRAGGGLGAFSLLALVTLGDGELALARRVGLLHGALRVDAGQGVRLLAAHRAEPGGGRLNEKRLGLSIVVLGHDRRLALADVDR